MTLDQRLIEVDQRHDQISTTFQRCYNVECPLGKDKVIFIYFYSSVIDEFFVDETRVWRTQFKSRFRYL